MKIIRLLIALPFLATTTTNAENGSGRITGFIPYSSGGKEIFFVKTETVSGTHLACNNAGRFAISSDSPHFKSTQSAVMAAMATGARVDLRGGGSCSVWSNSEDLHYLCVGDIPC